MHYKVFIDTGGTFTDCIAINTRDKKQFRKVLSNGTLRAEIQEWESPLCFRIKDFWHLKRDILRGYSFNLPELKLTRKIDSFDTEKHTLTLDSPLPEELLGQKLTFEITAYEEAPVLGTRLLTETGLNEKFPSLEVRLGSTRGTNALLENKGSKTALFITKGFKDLLYIGDQSRPDIFSKEISKQPPLVRKIIEIDERTDHEGKILKSPDCHKIQDMLISLREEGFKSIAIAFLNSYLNPENEKQVKKSVCNAGFQFISLSSELSSLIKLLERTQTAVVNAYLSPVIHNYLENISTGIETDALQVMTSAGGLISSEKYNPKDSLLSGPAGGMVGAALTGNKNGYTKLISLDMGGTSTDVSRYDHFFDYCYEVNVGRARIMSTALSIETVAAGGGSVCGFDGYKLFVGPESAGASPGPACYGAGGPLTITDVNLLLNKLSDKNFTIPVTIDAAKKKLSEILLHIETVSGKRPKSREILQGFIDIANETMAGAIRKISLAKGYSPSGYAMVSFGGAGGLHACGIARNLGINTILIPEEAGLLSAWGIANARVERMAVIQLLTPLSQIRNKLPEFFKNLSGKALKKLAEEKITATNTYIRQQLVYLRFKGQDSSIEIEYHDNTDLLKTFREKYIHLYGHWVENREVEVEALRVIASELKKEDTEQSFKVNPYIPEPDFIINDQIPVFKTSQFTPGAKIQGPALLLDEFSTFYLEKDCHYFMNHTKTGIVSSDAVKKEQDKQSEEAELELFSHRFMSIAENMGAMLQRTALSVNIKERMDFSCALLDAEGYLVANAPHIPVHLGGLGICVRELLKKTAFHPGDTVVTNHPAMGGSHLPDVTTISPVFNKKNKLLAFVVNRAHHSEIGGLSPGSMPPSAKNLAEEGVVIPPYLLVSQGKAKWDGIREILLSAPYPTRSVEENMADLNASLAANNKGIEEVQKLLDNYGEQKVLHYFKQLRTYAANRMKSKLALIEEGNYKAIEYLDDGSPLCVNINHSATNTQIDFSGSAGVSETNMNATLAIVHSVVIYVMRFLLNEPIPLNDGLLDPVSINVPEGMLNPDFPEDIFKCPAVVGGNVEISMRLTDTLLKAFGTMAASQGTMNNVLFGNSKFGYYETLAGGTGAGKGFHGTHATHHHMTNTRITDPEIIEHRYPVRLIRFSIRENSGGEGKYSGGNGLIREYEFLQPVNLSLLTQRRKTGPYGLQGGCDGKTGEQYIIRKNHPPVPVSGIDNIDINAGDRFLIKTPGGGGFGTKKKT